MTWKQHVTRHWGKYAKIWLGLFAIWFSYTPMTRWNAAWSYGIVLSLVVLCGVCSQYKRLLRDWDSRKSIYQFLGIAMAGIIVLSLMALARQTLFWPNKVAIAAIVGMAIGLLTTATSLFVFDKSYLVETKTLD